MHTFCSNLLRADKPKHFRICYETTSIIGDFSLASTATRAELLKTCAKLSGIFRLKPGSVASIYVFFEPLGESLAELERGREDLARL